ncbi:MAG: Calx-beta domain-containing protein, partial [Acidimicrobiia bacterium]
GETQQFTVATLDDAILEGTETFTVSLNATDPLVTDTDTGTGTITDNDSATITVDNVTAIEGAGLLFTVTLDNAVQGGFSVNVALTDVSAIGGGAPLVSPEDYDNVVAALSFAGTTGETQQFTVATLDDAVVEGTETFTVSLSSSNTLVTDTDTGIGTITDNDTAAVTLNNGTCAISGGSLTTSCTISPSLSDTTKTFMVFQATSSNNTPNSSNVRCFLVNASTITCDRFGTTGPVNIRWQTVEFASGVTVEHLTPACIGDITNVTIISVADMGRTFLVYSHAQSGIFQDGNDRRTVQLTTTSNVEIRQSGFGSCASGGTANALQVIQFTNASVTRGLTGAMTGSSLSVTGLPAVNTSKTMLIFSYRTLDSSEPNIAAGLVRGRIDSTTSLSFTRGDLSGQIDAIAWERIEFTDTSTVQQIDVSMAAGVGTANSTITSVDTSRSIAFAGGQWTAGQGFGETSYNGDDVIGVAVG